LRPKRGNVSEPDLKNEQSSPPEKHQTEAEARDFLASLAEGWKLGHLSVDEFMDKPGKRCPGFEPSGKYDARCGRCGIIATAHTILPPGLGSYGDDVAELYALSALLLGQARSALTKLRSMAWTEGLLRRITLTLPTSNSLLLTLLGIFTFVN